MGTRRLRKPHGLSGKHLSYNYYTIKISAAVNIFFLVIAENALRYNTLN